MIKEISVESMEELGQRLNRLPNHYVFRGQANANWGLQSSLERLLGGSWNVEKARKFEAHALNSFKSKYHNYCGDEHRPASKLSWLSVMQHYGGPTRLIDFTTSPYIALFFALETYNPQTPNDFSIFYIDYRALMDKSISFVTNRDYQFKETRSSMSQRQDEIFENVVDRYTYDVAWISEPNESNARIDRQNGTFLISGSLERKMDEILCLDLYADVDMVKLRVPSSAFEGAYVALRKMGINAKMIYGDLAGLSKSIRMELLAYA